MSKGKKNQVVENSGKLNAIQLIESTIQSSTKFMDLLCAYRTQHKNGYASVTEFLRETEEVTNKSGIYKDMLNVQGFIVKLPVLSLISDKLLRACPLSKLRKIPSPIRIKRSSEAGYTSTAYTHEFTEKEFQLFLTEGKLPTKTSELIEEAKVERAEKNTEKEQAKQQEVIEKALQNGLDLLHRILAETLAETVKNPVEAVAFVNAFMGKIDGLEKRITENGTTVSKYVSEAYAKEAKNRPVKMDKAV